MAGTLSFVSVIQASSGTTVDKINAGYAPDAAFFDSQDDEVYVTNYYSDNVSVINGSDNIPRAAISVGDFPNAVALDDRTGDLYVTDGWDFPSDNYTSISVLNGATNALMASIPITTSNSTILPTGIAYDDLNEDLYVGVEVPGEVDLLSSGTDEVTGSIEISENPGQLCFDGANGEIYVADWFNEASGSAPSEGDTVTIINGTTAAVTGTLQVGLEPYGVLFDPLNHDVYVSNFGSNSVSILGSGGNPGSQTNLDTWWMPVLVGVAVGLVAIGVVVYRRSARRASHD